MPTYFTPGSYIEEISKLPASVAPVATAIPAFIGYTEVDGGVAPNTPVRITSMLEYEEKFGGAFTETFEVTLTDTDAGVGISCSDPDSPYLIYYQLEMYFANGGGPCYIVSVDTYGTGGGTIDKSKLESGIDGCEMEDEITLLLVPEAIQLGGSDRKDINDKMLTQCSLLKDRFAIIDVHTGDATASIYDDGQNFRMEVGTEYLKYGGAYYPSLNTSIEYFFDEKGVKIKDVRSTPVYSHGSGTITNEPLTSLLTGTEFDDPSKELGEKAVYEIKIDLNLSSGDTIVVAGVSFEASNLPFGTSTDVVYFEIGADENTTASNLLAVITSEGIFNASASDSFTAGINAPDLNLIVIEANSIGEIGNNLLIDYAESTSGSILVAVSEGIDGINKSLYNQIKKELSKKKVTLYPCGAIAGVYARTDRTRGVWKAPANTSLNRVISPSKLITSEEQESLNVDATSGKSINAIRTFSGKGILVWGARTLAGNDNEWRYVNVRRLFIFIEESIKKATEFVVFEPNDANTWNRVKVMCENFLAKLWREGALAGAKPEEAFFVNVGLGVTMSANEILNGIMNVEIGIAAVRPAEFIVLKFSHKLQVS